MEESAIAERGSSSNPRHELPILTADVQATLWQFILLGLLVPIASVTLSLLLIHRLEQRFGIRRLGQPS